MSRAAALKYYQRALAQWPADILRPDVSFQKTIQRRVDRRLGASIEPNTARGAEHDARDTVDVNVELEQVNAMFSLLENRYSKKYPLSDHLLKPKSNPQYYKKLLTELEEAPKRSWLSRKINHWKGFLRLT